MVEAIIGIVARAFGDSIARWLTALVDGLIRDRANQRIGAATERDRARTEADRQVAEAQDAAREADRQPLDADDGFRKD